MLARFRELDIDVEVKDDRLTSLIEAVKAREFEGYAYDGAEASFELLARRALGEVPHFFKLSRFRLMDDRRWSARGELVTESEATVTIEVGGVAHMEVATGNGPVNALDNAIRKALLPLYPQLEDMRLVDYKVRILTPQAGTRAVTRVMIESADNAGRRWTTVGVSPNIIDASFNALHDGITWKLMQEGAEVPGPKS
jgi:2-isopropylmalate synthase